MAQLTRRDGDRRYQALTRVLRAYALAYISSTGPRALRILISLQRKDLRAADAAASLRRTLRQALEVNSLPTFCGTIVGLSSLLPGPLQIVLQVANEKLLRGKWKLDPRLIRVLSAFFASAIAAAVSFALLNGAGGTSPTVQTSFGEPVISVTESEPATRNVARKRSRTQSRIPEGLPPLPPEAVSSGSEISVQGIPLAGKTMDLTLFALVRALDVLVQLRPGATKFPSNRFVAFVRKSATPALFALSSAMIMHTFFYKPTRLPYTYMKWIDRIAELDERMLHALRQARYGNFVYGKDTGIAPLLGSMAKDCGLPEEWGDPAKTIPLPCELVHHGRCKSCELYAMWRFWRGFVRAMGVYLPLSAIVLARKLWKKRPGQSQGDIIRNVVLHSTRSSAFLGGFIALFYYGACLTRTRIGPRIFSSKTVTLQMYDSGLSILGGCTLCGWSVLLENARRRTELMLFVLPRAFSVVAPRRYPKEYLWREQLTFTLSAAVVMAAVKEQPEKVRGVFGRVLRSVLA